jgi:hypothetical protein
MSILLRQHQTDAARVRRINAKLSHVDVGERRA